MRQCKYLAIPSSPLWPWLTIDLAKSSISSLRGTWPATVKFQKCNPKGSSNQQIDSVAFGIVSIIRNEARFGYGCLLHTKSWLSKFLLMDDTLLTIVQWHHSIELLIEDPNFLVEVLHTFPDTPPVVTGSWHDWSQLQRLQGLLDPWPRYVVVHRKDLRLNGSPVKKIAAW